jgi:hypothetical protein
MEPDLPPPPVLPEAPPDPPEIGFHNRIAVRTSLFVAFSAVLLFMVLFPFPVLHFIVEFLSGFLAVFLYMRRTGQPLTMRGGARMGWITGIFSFTLITGLFTLAMVAVSSQGGLAAVIREHRGQLPGNGAQYDALMKVMDDPAAFAGVLLMSLVMTFLIVTTLSMLGGAFGAKILDRR